MNLWHKPIEQVNFQDVDTFCTAGWEEGVRLDYKAEWPNDLAKTIAAMANTVGGMIIIGVNADKTTNKPIWPPMAPVLPRTGFPMAAGLSERVYQVGQDAIFPPIMPEVSQVIENLRLPGQAIIVVRIPESKDAPHATEGRKAVYIYERTGNKGYAHALADIGYIERLFNRRNKIEQERENMIEAAIERGQTRIGVTECPYRWASVIPYYPWRPLCHPELCHQFHGRGLHVKKIAPYCLSQHYQKVPNGSFGIFFDPAPDKTLYPVACTNISDKGHVFGISTIIEQLGAPNSEKLLSYRYTADFLDGVIIGAIDFYKLLAIERPLYIQISLGMFNIRNMMFDEFKPRHRYRGHDSLFPDNSFRADTCVLQFGTNPLALAQPLLEELSFGFDAPPAS